MTPHDKEQRPEVGLKTYNRPRLEVYGDLRDITRAVGKSGGTDTGGNMPNTKTSP